MTKLESRLWFKKFRIGKLIFSCGDLNFEVFIQYLKLMLVAMIGLIAIILSPLAFVYWLTLYRPPKLYWHKGSVDEIVEIEKSIAIKRKQAEGWSKTLK